MGLLVNQVGAQLCAALGLPKNTRAFTLRAEAGKVVTVECEYFMFNDTGIVGAVSEYELVERRQAAAKPQAAPTHFDEWMRQRTEAAHIAFMERTAKHLPCDWRTFPPHEIERYFGAIDNGDGCD